MGTSGQKMKLLILFKAVDFSPPGQFSLLFFNGILMNVNMAFYISVTFYSQKLRIFCLVPKAPVKHKSDSVGSTTPFSNTPVYMVLLLVTALSTCAVRSV